MNTRPASLLLLALLSAVAASQGDASEVYAVDPDRSRIGFVIGHLGIKKVKGDFTNFTARITYRDGDKDGVTADAVIKVASIDTGWQARDEYVQGPDFFLSRE